MASSIRAISTFVPYLEARHRIRRARRQFQETTEKNPSPEVGPEGHRPKPYVCPSSFTTISISGIQSIIA